MHTSNMPFAHSSIFSPCFWYSMKRGRYLRTSARPSPRLIRGQIIPDPAIADERLESVGAIDWIITGPTFPPSRHIVDAELQLTACRLADRVVLHVPPNASSSGIGRPGRDIWYISRVEPQQLDPTVPNPQEIVNSRHVRAKFMDNYRLFIAMAKPITFPQLWDTAIGAHAGSSRFAEFGSDRTTRSTLVLRTPSTSIWD